MINDRQDIHNFNEFSFLLVPTSTNDGILRYMMKLIMVAVLKSTNYQLIY